MPLDDADIEAQRHSDTCADVAIINLFKLRGLEPPSYDFLDECFATAAPSDAVDRATNTTATFQILAALSSFVVAQVIIPSANYRAPHEIIKHFLDQGCDLLFFFAWREPEHGEIVYHVSVCEGISERGYLLIDGEFRHEGFPVEFELEPTMIPTAEQKDAAIAAAANPDTHGSRRVLPFCEVTSRVLAPMGITPHVGLLVHFIVAYPNISEGA